MKELWVKLNKSVSKNVKEAILKVAAKTCDAIYVEENFLEDAKKTGVKIAASSEDCAIQVLEAFDPAKIEKLKNVGKAVALRVPINGKEDVEKVVKSADFNPDYIIVQCLDWKVIPLENLIAKIRGKNKLLAEVSSAEDAKTALETLELGAYGVLLETSDPNELVKTASIVKKQIPKIKLMPVKIAEVKRIGTGARVCVDTCDLMKKGEGLLLGCQSSCLFLAEAEVHENPFVEPRPFRVNVGPASLYVLCLQNRTRYLSELKAGDEILIVDRNGNARLTNIGRVKIGWRPLILIEAKRNGKRFKTIAQNAETIRLVSEKGSIPVTELKAGDEVLAYISEGGRHFGTLVSEERVIEP